MARSEKTETSERKPDCNNNVFGEAKAPATTIEGSTGALENPNVSAQPVAAKPNHVREKTYQEPVTPETYEEQLQQLPEKTAKEQVRKSSHRTP